MADEEEKPVTREQIETEALTRAVGGMSFANYPPIIQGFLAKGIPESEIKPRENVFTFHAWRRLGRTVKRGEHGVKVVTFVRPHGEESEESAEGRKRKRGSFPKWTTVFHVSQTEELHSN